ncbi:MAG: fibronectin type III-like domain-contianing protein, partial [Cryobacterium sp.]
WLAGFAAVQLEAGASALVELALPARAFANWDEGWQYEAGTFAVHVGTSVTHTPLTAAINLLAARS